MHTAKSLWLCSHMGSKWESVPVWLYLIKSVFIIYSTSSFNEFSVIGQEEDKNKNIDLN